MNRAASLLAVPVAALIMGCQDGSITDPTTVSALNEVHPSSTQPMNTLSLNAVLREPGNVFNSLIDVVGAADYQTMVSQRDPVPPNPQNAVQLTLYLHAELSQHEARVPPDPLETTWRVSGSSQDWVPIPESGEAFLTKRYQVQGRSDGALLFVSLRITLTGVEVNRMWLELPSEVRAAERD